MTLRRWREDDAPAVYAACQDPEIPRWTNVPSPYSEDQAREFVAAAARGESGEAALAIVDPVSDELLGAIGLRMTYEGAGDVGYWIVAGARGRGVATRALRLLCGWAFEELELPRLQLHTLPENLGSQRVAEHAGFTREGVLRSWTEMKGRRVDLVMYSLLPGELAAE